MCVYIYAENIFLLFFFVKCLFNTSNSLKVDNTKRDVIATNKH